MCLNNFGQKTCIFLFHSQWNKNISCCQGEPLSMRHEQSAHSEHYGSLYKFEYTELAGTTETHTH